MRRTRKWAFVAQEAQRLADLGLSPPEIARRLGVRRSSVNRWMAAGKLTDTRKGSPRAGVQVTTLTKPSEWASAVRLDFALDATDEQLVTMAESALGTSLDPMQSMSIRLQAMRTFQGLVKQLALVARNADVAPRADAPVKSAVAAPRVVPRRASGDPRTLLMAVAK